MGSKTNNWFKNMPVYLVILQVAKKILQFALRGPKLPALFEACNRGPGTKEISLEWCFILSNYLLKLNCLIIFLHG